MFDTTIVKQGSTEYIPYEKTVTEIKAPTDESIRLLNEFKTKILKDTVSVFQVRNDSFNCVIRFCQNVGEMCSYAVIKFELNGEEITKTFNLDQFSMMLNGETEVAKIIIKKYQQCVLDLMTEKFVHFELIPLLKRK